MNLLSFKILADENIDLSISDYLTSKGFDVFSIKGSGLEGSPDIDNLALAVSQNRIIITHDTDFTTIAHRDKAAFIGIIFLQPGHIQSSFTIRTLDTLFSQSIDIKPPFIIVAENNGSRIKIRIRNNVEVH